MVFCLGPGSGQIAPVTEEQAAELATKFKAAIFFFAELAPAEV